MSYTPKILVVDDDPTICYIMEKTLTPEGYEVKSGGSGREALECLAENTFDLVLLDIGLPDMDGFETMSHIHRDSPETIVIMITGDATIESAVKALKSGAYNYLTKPFHIEALRKTIINALDHKRLESHRKQSQKALRESEKRFRNLVENSLIGISIIQNNKIIYQNPEQSELFNPLPKKLDANLLEYVHPDDVNKVKGCYQSLISGKTRSVEADFRFSPPGKKDAKVDMRWVQCRASIFKHKGNDALLVNTTDITRAKELEHILRVKSKMISLGRVAAGIAHEIRNPLTGINSYLYTLDDFLDTEILESEKIKIMKKIVGQLQVASNKIESVIKRVLDFSKPGAPVMALVNINKSLKEAINLSAVSLRKNKIKIEQSLEQGLPNCYADSQLIEQAILNLINNAAKALEKAEGHRIIEVTSASEKNRVLIRVSDSGPGVPLELRDKMFDPFFTTRQDGSGIGLSIAQRIIADHSGSIDVGSSKLGGAEFRIELPIDKRNHKR